MRKKAQKIPISIIVCAKNEADNIRENLPYVLEQNYPAYEVVVVDDFSTDNTLAELETLSKEYTHLKVIKAINESPGKKAALKWGIQNANYNYLLLTDADCKPASKQWISEMASNFSTSKQIVIGYGPFYKNKGFLNKIFRYEALMVATHYFSMALRGMPYMAVGRNVAYKTKIIERKEGKQIDIPSGDDDLFLNPRLTSKNVAVEMSPQSFMYSKMENDWKTWYRKKIRHNSTAKYYRWQHKLVLLLFHSSQFLFYTLLTILCFRQQYALFVISMFLVRLMTQYYIMYRVTQKIGERDLVRFIPLLDFIYYLFYFIFIPFLHRKQMKWK